MIDFSLDTDVVVTNALDEAVQELDILFNTIPTEMIGNHLYGVNFLQFLWQLQPSEYNLQKYIREKIEAYTYYVKRFSYEVNVSTTYIDAELAYVIRISLSESIYDDPVLNKQYLVKQ